MRPSSPCGKLVLAVLALLAAAPPSSAARVQEPCRRALLVGCDEYPFLRERLGERYENEIALSGPANDVELLRVTLERVLGLAPENTVVLAGWPENLRARPTRANIVAALEQLERDARTGDLVIVYLAGHGSQQRVQRIKVEEEPDGLEEIFLPADVRPADRDQDYIPGALRDDELGERLRAIRERGAEVWFLVDSCHSGTMLRGGADGVRLRGIDPRLLGLSPATRGGAERAPPSARGWLDGTDVARIAALYGATSYGRAPEMALSTGANAPVIHGLFTYLLCRELERLGPGTSYRELAERVVVAYQAFPCAITVPTAEGDLERGLVRGPALEALVCTVRDGVPFLNQGRLAGLEPGARVQLFALEQGVEHAVARVEIVAAELFEARGKLLEGALAPETGPWRGRTESRPLGDYRLALAFVHPDGTPAAREELAPETARELERHAQSFALVADPRAADWCIVLTPGPALWLRPGAREGGFDRCDVRPEELVDTLQTIQRTRNLRRFAGSGLTAEWQSDLQVWVERHDSRGWQRVGSDDPLRPGEKIRVRLQKTSPAIYDVNAFYLDANFGARLLPSRSGSTRLPAEAQEALDLTGELTVTDDALGLENLLVFATPRTSTSPVVDLSVLEQRGLTRGAPADPLEELLRTVYRGENTRGQPAHPLDTHGTQSLLLTLRTEWAELGPPAWPPRSRVLEHLQRAPGADERSSGPGSDDLPDPWLPRPRAALMKSSKERARSDLLLLGGQEVEAVLIDLDQGVASGADLERVVRERAFDAEAAFLFGARRLAFYDRTDRGVFDLVLEDADADGVAEVLWTLETADPERVSEPWRRVAPVALPWLSQSHLQRGERSALDISARFRALQRSP